MALSDRTERPDFDAGSYRSRLRELREDPPGSEESTESTESAEPSEARGSAPQELVGRPRNEVEPERYIHPGDDIERRLRDVRQQVEPDEFGTWVPEINPKYDEFPPESAESIPWTNNCGDCSRRFADAYQDVDVHAAYGDGRAGPGEGGEMWQWAGTRPEHALRVEADGSRPDFTRAAWERLNDSLDRQPVGTVAIVGVDWHDPRLPDGTAGGHWFNAVRTEQGVAWVDAQSGQWSDWPPGYRTPIWRMEAVVRRRGGSWEEADLG